MNNETGDPWSEQKFRQLLFYHKKKNMLALEYQAFKKKKKKKLQEGQCSITTHVFLLR